MRSRIINKLRARLVNLVNPESTPQASDHHSVVASYAGISPRPSYTTAVNEFYGELLSKNLTSFNSFALQSRSVLIRDVYAREASQGRHAMLSLQMEVNELLSHAQHDKSVLETKNYNLPVLLSLGHFILNTAQNDLDTHTGLQIFRLIFLKHGAEALSDKDKLQFIEALASMGEYEEQDRLSEHFDLESIAPIQADLLAIDRIAHQNGDASTWVDAMNEFYAHHGMDRIRLKEDASLPLLDRLTSNISAKVDGPLVSVVMPTFKPNRRIFTAVESLLCQTWNSIEILIVDDGSPADFDQIFVELAQLDPRIRVIRQASNGGAYTARNTGLAEASGTFVTTHDDDDWSHPNKLEEQASRLVDDDSIMAITAGHIRTTSDMRFRRINAKPQHLQTNYSSLMFRKTVTDSVGSWDTSKRGSDTELVDRIKAHYGKTAVINLADKPLSFSRVWDGSLTSGEIYRGYFAYSRLLYRWAFRQWHRDVKRSGEKPVLRTDESRPFAVPTTFEPANRNKDLGLFDVIYVTDFNQRSKFASQALEEIKTALESGLRVGYMHINSPQTVRRSDFISDLFDMQLEGTITQVAETDIAETKLLVVHDSSIGMFLDQFRSTVVVRRGILVHDSGKALKGAVRKSAAQPSIALRHLDQSFNTTFSIVGTEPESQDVLEGSVPPARLLEETWKTPISLTKGLVREPGTPPVVGFHSFGNKYRWPSTREAFKEIYDGHSHKSLFYGNTAPVKQQHGEDIIRDEQIVSFNQTSLPDFFEMVDFWVHYPHERLGNHTWTAVLEALAAGKVVILPHTFESTYGDAALYASAEEVSSVVAEYSENVSAYVEQAERGQLFIEENYSKMAYLSRLKGLALKAEI